MTRVDLVARTATGNIYRTRARAVTAFLPEVLVLQHDLARRALYPKAQVDSTVAQSHGGEDAFLVHALIEGRIVDQFSRLDHSHQVAFALTVLAFHRTQGADGIEGLLGTVLNHLWYRAPHSLTAALLAAVDDATQSEFGAEWPVYTWSPTMFLSSYDSAADIVITDDWRRRLADETNSVTRLPGAQLTDALDDITGGRGGGFADDFSGFLGEDLEDFGILGKGDPSGRGENGPSSPGEFWDESGFDPGEWDTPAVTDGSDNPYTGTAGVTSPAERGGFDGGVPTDQNNYYSSDIQDASENAKAAGSRMESIGKNMQKGFEKGSVNGFVAGIIGIIIEKTGTNIREQGEADEKADKAAKEEAAKNPPATGGGTKTPNPNDDSGGSTPVDRLLPGGPVAKLKKAGRRIGVGSSSGATPGGLPPDGFVDDSTITPGTRAINFVDPLYDPHRLSFGNPDKPGTVKPPEDMVAITMTPAVICYIGAGLGGLMRQIGEEKFAVEEL